MDADCNLDILYRQKQEIMAHVSEIIVRSNKSVKLDEFKSDSIRNLSLRMDINYNYYASTQYQCSLVDELKGGLVNKKFKDH